MENRNDKGSTIWLSFFFFLIYFLYLITFLYHLLFILSNALHFAIFCFFICATMFAVLFRSTACMAMSFILMSLSEIVEASVLVALLRRRIMMYGESSYKNLYIIRRIYAVLLVTLFVMYIRRQKQIKKEKLETLQKEIEKTEIQIKAVAHEIPPTPQSNVYCANQTIPREHYVSATQIPNMMQQVPYNCNNAPPALSPAVKYSVASPMNNMNVHNDNAYPGNAQNTYNPNQYDGPDNFQNRTDHYDQRNNYGYANNTRNNQTPINPNMMPSNTGIHRSNV